MSTEIRDSTENVGANSLMKESPPTCDLLVVLGMHRSGTSALAGLLHAAGAAVTSKLLDDQPEINEKGFWEDSSIVAINDRLMAAQQLHWFDWQGIATERLLAATDDHIGTEAEKHLRTHYLGRNVAVCKDPRLCRTLPFWKRCMSRAGLHPLYLLTLRHPAEVAASLQKRDGLPREYGILLWMVYTLEALAALTGERCLAVDYTQVLDSPSAVVTRIAEAAGTDQFLTASQENIEQAVDVNLRHHTEHRRPLMLPDLQRQGESLYQALLDLPCEAWGAAAATAGSYLADNQTHWSLVGTFALGIMRQSGELVAIGEKHQHALNIIAEKDRALARLADEHTVALTTIAEKDRDIARLADEHTVALTTIAEKDRDIARLADEHTIALSTIAERDTQLQKEVAWREHLEQELRKCQVELTEFNAGLLALPLHLRRKVRRWLQSG